MPDRTPFKLCAECKQEFPATTEFFSPDRRNKAGLQARCKTCNAAWQRRYRKEHTDVVHATDKRRSNTERRRAQSRAEYARHREHKLAQKRVYRETHPEKIRANASAQRARRNNAPGAYTADELKAIYQLQRGNCWWCGEKLGQDAEPDHRIPLSRGGTNNIDNIVLSCFKCNRNKYNKLPHEWNGRLL